MAIANSGNSHSAQLSKSGQMPGASDLPGADDADSQLIRRHDSIRLGSDHKLREPGAPQTRSILACTHVSGFLRRCIA